MKMREVEEASRDLERAIGKKNLQSLEAAVDVAVAVGVAEDLIDKGRKRLDLLQAIEDRKPSEREEAARALCYATNSRGLDFLEFAVARAEAMNVAEELVFPARRLLESLRADS